MTRHFCDICGSSALSSGDKWTLTRAKIDHGNSEHTIVLSVSFSWESEQTAKHFYNDVPDICAGCRSQMLYELATKYAVPVPVKATGGPL